MGEKSLLPKDGNLDGGLRLQVAGWELHCLGGIWFWVAHLPLRDADGLSEHDPGDALAQRGRGQGAWVGPVVPAGRQEVLGVEAAELGLGALGRVGTQESAQTFHQDQPSTHCWLQDLGFFLAH
jgi:hypothetical protein